MRNPLAQRKIGALDKFCLRAIAFYQRHISPRKGYRCAYARLNGGTGCSGFARSAIGDLGWRAARPRIKARFQACQLAAQTLRAERNPSLDKPNDKKTRDWRDSLSDACCVDFSWLCCADSLLDGSICEAASCADASCADASCADAACSCHPCH